MVKTRLIPVLYIMNGLIVRSEKFSYHQIIGNVINEARRYNEWNVDELIYIDITRLGEYDLGRSDHRVKSYTSMEEIMDNISKVCFMPLTFGGGIKTMEQIDFFINRGADKITLNSAAIREPSLITKAAAKYGSQAVVLSVDYRLVANEPVVYTNFGSENSNIGVLDWVKECERLGAGEIFLNAIDRDGCGNGFDIETIGTVVNHVGIPVIACGGAGDVYDFLDLAQATKVSGIAAGNFFHFTERSYPKTKQLLLKNKVNVRA